MILIKERVTMNRLETLTQLLEENPNDEFVLYGLGLEYLNSDLVKAEYYFNLLLKDFPEYLPTYYQAGKLLEKKNATETSIEVYQKGIKLAIAQNNKHTQSELVSALSSLTETDEDGDDW